MSISNPHDRYFREVFSNPGIVRDLLSNYLPAAVTQALDLTTLTLEQDSFVDEELRQHYTDLLYTVRRIDGADALEAPHQQIARVPIEDDDRHIRPIPLGCIWRPLCAHASFGVHITQLPRVAAIVLVIGVSWDLANRSATNRISLKVHLMSTRSYPMLVPM